MKVRYNPCLCLLAFAFGAAVPSIHAQDASQPPAAPPPTAPSAGDTGGASAPPPPPGRRGAQMLERLKEKLSLTDDQTGQIKQILKEQMQQGRALRQDDSLSDDDRRAKMLALMKTAHDQIRALLTPDQQKIFDTMPMGGGRRRGSEEGASGAPPPGEPPPPLPPPPPS